jgi:hypothetical protein
MTGRLLHFGGSLLPKSSYEQTEIKYATRKWEGYSRNRVLITSSTKIFFLSKVPRSVLRHNYPPTESIPLSLFHEVKWQERGTDKLLASNALFKNACSFTSAPIRLCDLYVENINISLIWLLEFRRHENVLSVGSLHAREMHIGSPEWRAGRLTSG